MSSRVKDLYAKLISSDIYDNQAKCEVSHRILKAITREDEVVGEDLHLRVSDTEDSEKMNIMLWTTISLPHGQTIRNDLNYSDEEMLQFIYDLSCKEKEQEKGREI